LNKKSARAIESSPKFCQNWVKTWRRFLPMG